MSSEPWAAHGATSRSVKASNRRRRLRGSNASRRYPTVDTLCGTVRSHPGIMQVRRYKIRVCAPSLPPAPATSFAAPGTQILPHLFECCLMARWRVRCPPPSLSEQAPHSCHRSQMQSTQPSSLQGASLQLATSASSASQGRPPCLAGTRTRRYRVDWPPPQDRVQTCQGSSGETKRVQLTEYRLGRPSIQTITKHWKTSRSIIRVGGPLIGTLSKPYSRFP